MLIAGFRNATGNWFVEIIDTEEFCKRGSHWKIIFSGTEQEVRKLWEEL